MVKASRLANQVTINVSETYEKPFVFLHFVVHWLSRILYLERLAFLRSRPLESVSFRHRLVPHDFRSCTFGYGLTTFRLYKDAGFLAYTYR